jgi:6,7-dimethyl-8-ribityllumazine synthase
VVRGETPHFEHVARAAADGLQRVAVETGVPVIFGVLTTNTMAQARARSRWPSSRRTRRDGKESYNNKGWEAAQAAFEMSALMKAI